ncbi:hypothetical protein CR205_12930 [Alteribacter lacisalsi]|uniref:DUF4297 domain-containing protein n=1 Tax=Alteribacter lacisalsi TaxID=2045244 RepID=A0A2W0HSN7_9BACI|nr:hypothetical protein [Alteribacter lacisalsi]PYZ96608.1 hypothetical protein CR205_12930 [Alteribacter lacisalsi]
MSQASERDGGYYAVKGFIYQFDLTILEILNHPSSKIMFEFEQDINYEKYVIQVKHKETQTFTNSAIKKPVIQLLDAFVLDNNKKFALYCYFKDKEVGEKVYDLIEFNKLLGKSQNKYSEESKKEFIKNFKVVFKEDYNRQFEIVLDKIRQEYELASKELAVIYHMIIHSSLLKLAIREKKERYIDKSVLDEMFHKTSGVIFQHAYRKHLSKERYEKEIKRLYFSPRTQSRRPRERLFILECDNLTSNSRIADIVYKIIEKYYKSPKPPYVLLRNLTETNLIKLKSQIINEQWPMYFNDGSFFYGGEISVESIVSRDKRFDDITFVIFLNQDNLNTILERISIAEVYEFFIDNPIVAKEEHSTSIQISDTSQIIRLLN